MAEHEPYQVTLELQNLVEPVKQGPVVLRIHPEWAPQGAHRFKELLEAKYFDDCCFHRVVPDFIIQWGIPADPSLYKQYGDNKIKDDPVRTSNKERTISFATSGPNARGSQMFVNLANNESLDSQGFAPFAEVLEGFELFASIFAGYADRGPDQTAAKENGNEYLKKRFPKLSYIERAYKC
mmetsp:Transcript_26085/g.43077  ORF Transcript_26085/g.43077 Transcript_26085/m.43077 type:complete len:181 (-) Transcript_26085:383-925(-)|eukprot:CAMPEP_0119315464 /NCGR_PEP_ID=MMETSP1333-20130426/35963_1 /TAXON_ID=418940 /ORGANISM="Scyphosphaera apsteinii, Strain RCC1455" /LENGTH=180 /DNA_ID=CAMNT_0007320831 /DNA_START=25 /DNA_END=567 /DNA_ORIENTATION=-